LKRRIDHEASFKDPAAKVFSVEDDDEYIYRELSLGYFTHYHHFKSSGLAEELVKKNLLVSFEESQSADTIILKAKKIRFVSYPYEWSFNQWKDAALLTLKVQYQALKHGMILKDATPFNVVFDGCKPLFVDISSFEIYKAGEPWKAFKQFSENFYLPILLLKYFDATGNHVYQNNIAGIPLSSGLKMLPAKAYFNFNTLLYLVLPRSIRDNTKANKKEAGSKSVNQKSLMQFSEQLFSNIDKLKQSKVQTKWNDYYDRNVGESYRAEKESVIVDWISNCYQNKVLIDFGCNTGNFSRLAAKQVGSIIAFDEDMRSVDELYNSCKENKLHNIFSFTASISQPTPAVGWNNKERSSLQSRTKGDVGMALALIHHLAITNHINFAMMAGFFSSSCKELIIEFVPKEDDKVQLLLANREDIFDWYSENNFVAAFEEKFILTKQHRFSNSRVLIHFTPK
jgi:ribosomal protein L11 methylase PrmA